MPWPQNFCIKCRISIDEGPFSILIRLAITFCCLLWVQTAIANCNDDADQARREGRIQDSISQLKDCLSENIGQVARSYLLLGIANYDQKNQAAAIDYYTKAIATVADYPGAYTNRGLSEAMIGDFNGAMADLNHAIELNQKDMHAWYFRGFAWDKQQKPAKAIADYSTALGLAKDPNHQTLILYRRGLAYVKQRDNDDALKDFNDAINIDAGYAPAYFARATLRRNRGDIDGALADYSHVIELNPTDAEARYRRGVIYREQRKDHLAIADYSHALEIDPHMEKARAGRSFVYLIPILPVLLVLALG